MGWDDWEFSSRQIRRVGFPCGGLIWIEKAVSKRWLSGGTNKFYFSSFCHRLLSALLSTGYTEGATLIAATGRLEPWRGPAVDPMCAAFNDTNT